MKKLITICLLVATFVTATAQTKEETISWLKEKFDKYLIGRQENTIMVEIVINECEIIFHFIEGDSKSKTMLTLPTDGLNILENGFGTNGELIGFKAHESQIIYANFANCFRLKIGEKDLKERVKKALTHLATFCPEKQKETF